jgi:NAD(P)-dependent dehydrogenase (short-subunit alcohol dehydrogenase family)
VTGHVLVTGAGGDIGRAICVALAHDGVRVTAADIQLSAADDTADRVRASGGEARCARIDVADERSVASVTADAQRIEPLTAAVAAAGVISTQAFLDLDLATWRRTLDVNLQGTFLLLREFGRLLVRDARGGAFVAIASNAGFGGRPLNADYAASKAAVISLIRSSAIALAPANIRVNAVCPGVIDTQMTRVLHEDRSERSGSTAARSLQEALSTVPLGHVGTTDDVAAAVTFLLSDAANYITGEALSVDGGLKAR